MKLQIEKDIDEFADCPTEKIADIYDLICENPRLLDAVSIVDISSNFEVTISWRCRKEESRSTQIINLISDSMAYARRLGRSIPSTRLFLYCSDVYAFEHQELPFLVMAKPKNKRGILIPDNTYFAHLAPSGLHESWSEIKQKCAEKQTPWVDKEAVMYFRGADTDKHKQDVRSSLSDICCEESQRGYGSIFKVFLEGREELAEFARYKYLLNLPGKQPWSYRFKYLFLMRSLVINVDVRQRYKGASEYNDSWVNAFDAIFEPNVDYINLIFHWEEGNSEHNERERQNLIKSLRDVHYFFERNGEACHQIVENGSRKIDVLSDEFIYDYIYHLVVYYAKIIGPKLR
jgi:hypothetical protein